MWKSHTKFIYFTNRHFTRDLYTNGIGNSYINHVNLINSRESRDFARSTYFHWRHLEFRMRRLPDWHFNCYHWLNRCTLQSKHCLRHGKYCYLYVYDLNLSRSCGVLIVIKDQLRLIAQAWYRVGMFTQHSWRMRRLADCNSINYSSGDHS